jgi:very-short-patch-repair endonuclease
LKERGKPAVAGWGEFGDKMSLSKKHELIEISKNLCRDLRRRSTKAENILWDELRRCKLCDKKFYRQYSIFHDIIGIETFFIADFYCHSEKLIIELDGGYHKYRLHEDEKRTEILNYLGLRVIRFANEEIEKDLKNVLEKIQKSFSEIL